ncbi:Ldh family oxidoreductase [Halogeometricum luteum]|uniref:Ldh family oxidoreductase n=1 Tax=Halogeometricum luteum TaxID=2950537 RepID=A0ABU2G2H1_9EURY|nr:Ldh family oxidoreductase [Halogeometricum sp. S3BR5-2]MDS0294976.1 Ldh family oxidoreductase [Halogeometricum sp. S3BR5-2]
MTRADTLRFEPEALEQFAEDLLGAAGLTAPHCETVAKALVRADLRGVDSHGVARLEPYVEHLEAGGYNPDPEITLTERGPSALVVDADHGPGQSAGTEAMRRLIEMAAETGVAVGVVRHSNHFGTAAYYTEMAAEHGCIGFAMTNVPAQVIPFGGKQPYLGTNPISVSVPSPLEYPITLDMATSVVAMGKIDHVAAEKGESVPEEWGVDSEGNPTTDPNQITALRPLGGPKGYCLGVIVDLLSGVLSGANISADVGSLYGEYDQSMDLGHFYLAIDVATFRELDAFLEHVGRFVEGLKAVETEDGVDEVLLPGEIESKALIANRERGVPVNGSVFEKLTAVGAEYGIEAPSTLG